ncbi:MAG: preprotein translocase subunit SecE [Ruminococcaceae bacterium]|nr:preprotein translocase subunit SecE [Oscillospiraceae bacterium]
MADEIKKDSVEATPEKKEPAKAKQPKKAKKRGFFKRIGNFFREYRSELKKVVWYPRSRVIRDTGVAVAVLVVCGIIVGVLDEIFGGLIYLLGKIGG